MDDCAFCSNNEAAIIETPHAKVLLSNPRKVPGHALVVPKRHIEQPWELNETEVQEIFSLISRLQKRVIGELGQGCDVRQNFRPYVSENAIKKNHIVFHVIPRSPDDYIYSVSEKYEDDLFATLDAKEALEVAKLLGGKE